MDTGPPGTNHSRRGRVTRDVLVPTHSRYFPRFIGPEGGPFPRTRESKSPRVRGGPAPLERKKRGRRKVGVPRVPSRSSRFPNLKDSGSKGGNLSFPTRPSRAPYWVPYVPQSLPDPRFNGSPKGSSLSQTGWCRRDPNYSSSVEGPHRLSPCQRRGNSCRFDVELV